MAAQSHGALAPIVFSFQSTHIRTLVDDHGEPWFCASDVCEVLGYVNTRDAINKHCHEKGIAKRDTLTEGGKQNLIFINEGNLYRLITRSQKPEAEKFEEMVMDEILPAIRKTGSYQHQPQSLPATQLDALSALHQQLLKSLPKLLIDPPVWTRPKQAAAKGQKINLQLARMIITELQAWANTLPNEIGAPLWVALDDLDTVLSSGQTQIEEALQHHIAGTRLLQEWFGKEGK